MPTQEQKDKVKHHKGQVRHIQETIAGNPTIDARTLMLLHWLSYSTHRRLMSADNLYKEAINQAYSEEWRKLILKRIERRNKRSTCCVEEVPAPEIETEEYYITTDKDESIESVRKLYSEKYMMQQIEQKEKEMIRVGNIACIFFFFVGMVLTAVVVSLLP